MEAVGGLSDLFAFHDNPAAKGECAEKEEYEIEQSAVQGEGCKDCDGRVSSQCPSESASQGGGVEVHVIHLGWLAEMSGRSRTCDPRCPLDTRGEGTEVKRFWLAAGWKCMGVT